MIPISRLSILFIGLLLFTNLEAQISLTCPSDSTAMCDVGDAPPYSSLGAFLNAGGAVSSVNNIDSASFQMLFQEITGPKCDGTVSRIYQVLDVFGNQARCTHQIFIGDLQSPTIALRATTINCTDTIPPPVTSYAALLQLATILEDNCSIDTSSFRYVRDTTVYINCRKNINRYYSISDSCGNLALGREQFIFLDNEPPSFTVPPDITLFRDANCSYDSDTAITGSPSDVVDNCTDTLNPVFRDNIVGVGCNEMIIRAWAVADRCANITRDTQRIFIADTTRPTFTQPADITIYVNSSCTYNSNTSVTGDVLDEMDNCTNNLDAVFSDTRELNGCNGTGRIIRTWSLSDSCGNSITRTQYISIQDNLPPIFIEARDTTMNCEADTSVSNTGLPDISGTCDAEIDISHYDIVLNNMGNCTNEQLIKRVWRVADGCNNVSIDTQYVNLIDTTPPITLCKNISIQLDSFGNASITVDDINNGTNDACSNSVRLSSNQQVFSCNDLGVQPITLYSIDECGNIDSCISQLIIEDLINPQISCSDITTIVDNNCEAIVNFTIDTSDNCCIDRVVKMDLTGLNSGDMFPVGRTLLKYRVFDCSGNFSDCEFSVNVFERMPEGFTLACNDMVNVSLDSTCSVTITRDMITEGSFYRCDQSLDIRLYLFTIDEDNFIPTSPVLNGDYVGDTIIAKIIDIRTGNSCWGKLIVEDKFIPELQCSNDTIRCSDDTSPEALGFPVPDHLDVLPTGVANTYTIPLWDSCGDITLSYVDTELNGFDCYLEFKEFTRTWTSRDESGNERICIDTISIYLPNLSLDTILLKDTILACDGGWPSLPNGHPSPDATGWPIPQGCNTIVAGYEDTRIDVCGATFKILRKWKLIDWCSNPGQINEQYPKLSTYFQIIKVVDEVDPLLYCPTTSAARDTLGMDYYKCSATYYLPIPEDIPVNVIPDANKVYVIAECSSWEYRVRYVPAKNPNDCTPDGSYGRILGDWKKPTDPGFVISDLPTGCNWFYYEVVDACGNKTECAYDIEVVDDLAPTAVCDEHTSLTLNLDGQGKIYAQTFDDGSFDNCGIDSFAVRRMDKGAPCGWNIPDFSSFVEFCCEDAGSTILVEFLVVDISGNSATCMVAVEVNDKEPPVLKAPTDVTIDCRFSYDIDNLSETFGRIVPDPSAVQGFFLRNDPHYSRSNNWLAGYDGYAYDNCGSITVQETATADLHCGRGTITRYFTVTDKGGLVSKAQQVITIDDENPFDENDIHWPRDVLRNPIVTDCIGGVDTDPSTSTRVDSAYGARNLSCALVTVSYKDDIIKAVDSACYKIVRTWTVVDWCQFKTAGDPIWEHKQYIKVTNYNAPVFAADVCEPKVFCDSTSYLLNGACVGYADLKARATDDCTPDEQLQWTYQLDLGSTGTFGGLVRSNDASGRYPLGVHKVRWTVSDVCGNISQCETTFEVKECKQPTPYCRTGLVTVVMPSSGRIEVWAKDFNIGSFDNCTAAEDLRYSFTEDGRTPSMLFTCGSLGGQAVLEREVQMWVIDESGNRDFCTTTLRIQDNDGSCSGNLKGSISGLLGRMDDTALKGSTLELKVLGSDNVLQSISSDGDYRFASLSLFENYVVEAHNRYNYTEGVSTRDLVAIQKHLLGIKDFKYAWQYAAADANKSYSVSTADIAQLRKLILGKWNELPKQDSWVLYNDQTDMEDEEQLMSDRNLIMALDLEGELTEKNFHGIKVGDVNGDVNLSGLSDQLTIRSGSIKLKGEISTENGKSRIAIQAGEDMSLEGIQFTFEIPQVKTLLEGIRSGRLEIASANYALHEDAITLSWASAESLIIEEGETLMTIVLKGEKDMDEESDIEMSSSITRAMAYLSGEEDRNIDFSLRSVPTDEQAIYALMQNRPNPFGQSTIIGYQLPQPQEVVITFKDMTGRILKAVTISGQKGYNEIEVSVSELQATGVIYYSLETESFFDTKKMLLLD